MKNYTVICNVSRNEQKVIHGDHFRGERHYVPVLRDAPLIGDREPPAQWEPYRCDCYHRLASVQLGDDYYHYYFYDLVTAAQANAFMTANGII